MAKGIRSVWTDSDTPESLGNKVIRDDVEIATVPNGVQEYKDPDVVVNREYKYVIQSYTATGQSTDEVLGENLNYYTIVEASGLTPIMTNFRVADATPTHIHFDTPLGPVTGLTTQGFVVSGKNIIDINTTLGYIEVDTPFDFWDNASIRLGEHNDTSNSQSGIYDFTLEEIVNNVAEPDALNYKYVEVGASGSGNSIGDPASIVDAINNGVGGETWWIKAGDYGNITAEMDVKINGSENSPCKLIGYKNTIGDITTNYIDDYNDIKNNWSTAEMPTLTGGGSGVALYWWGTSYIIIRNLQFDSWQYGVQSAAEDQINHNFVFDRVNGRATSSNGLSFATKTPAGSGGDGWKTWYNNKSKLTNIRWLNSGTFNVWISGYGENLLKDIKSYADIDTAGGVTDYLIGMNGYNNITSNCYVENFNANGNASHGITLRGDHQLDNRYNLIVDSTAINCVEAHAIRNYGCDFNVIKRCHAGNNQGGTHHLDTYGSGGLYIWGGSDWNVIEQCTVSYCRTGMCWFDNQEENNHTSDNIGSNNVVRNCVFDNLRDAIYVQGDSNSTFHNNKMINCTWDTFNDFLYTGGSYDSVGNEIINCNITNGGGPWTLTGLTHSNSNYFGNESNYVAPGTGNLNLDPQYVSASDLTPQNDSLIAVSRLFGVERDLNNNERAATTTIGSTRIETN